MADDLEQARAALTTISPAPFNAEAPPEAFSPAGETGVSERGYTKRPRALTPQRRQAAPRATQAFAETTNGGSGSLSLQSSRNAVRRSGLEAGDVRTRRGDAER